MRIFLDTASAEELRKVREVGFRLDGMTTNPTHIAKFYADNPISYRDLTYEFARRQGVWDISEETIGCYDYDPKKESVHLYVEEAMIIHSIGSDYSEINPVKVKIPATRAGIEATRIVAACGVAVNSTLVFTPEQAELSARAGARYVSPFIGRLYDIGEDGLKLVEKIISIYRKNNYATEILTASVRCPEQVEKAYELGSHIVTMPYSVFDAFVKEGKLKSLQEMQKNDVSYRPERPVDFRKLSLEIDDYAFRHPKLAEGVERFLEDGKSAKVRERILASVRR